MNQLFSSWGPFRLSNRVISQVTDETEQQQKGTGNQNRREKTAVFRTLSEHTFSSESPRLPSITNCQNARGLERAAQNYGSLLQVEKSLSTQEGNRFPDGGERVLQDCGKELNALSMVLKA